MTADNIADRPIAGRPGTFFGEPRALAYLAFTEAWERFSYYGMTALLTLYLAQSLLLPGHVEHIAGFVQFRAGLESVFGPMTPTALASQIFGLYSAFIYFTPVFGGLIADRWLGHRRAVMLGAVLMSAGHIAMAFDQSFLLAIALLIAGCGLLKGNISAQVGELYAEDDASGRTRGFTIFSIGINVGAVTGPLLCGLLAELYGWHAGFGLAGVLMLIGLATYLAGYRQYAPDRPVSRERKTQAPLSGADLRAIVALSIVGLITVFQTVAYYQNGNVNLIWIDQAVDLNILGFHVPVAWFNSIDPLVSIVGVPPLLALWRWQSRRRGGEPDAIAKIGIGAWIAAAANLLLVAACLASGHPPAIAPVFYDILLGIAFLYYWPTFLSFVSQNAPPQVKAAMMGAAFLSMFLGNFMVGWLGQYYEHMSPAAFWAMHAGVATVGGVLAFLMKRPVKALLRP